jgi:hypothetical protein
MHRTEEIERMERELCFTLVAVVGGCRSVVSLPQVRQ